MIINKIYQTAILLCLFVAVAQGQVLPQSFAFKSNSFAFNPGAAGMDAEGERTLRMFALNRNYWMNETSSPTAQILSADGLLKDGHIGLGGSFYNEKIHIFRRTGVSASYAYHIFPSDNPFRLSMGLSAGWEYQRINANDANPENASDPLLTNSAWQGHRFTLGFGVSTLWKIDDDNIVMQGDASLLNMPLYKLLNKNYLLQDPSALIGYVRCAFDFGFGTDIYRMGPSVYAQFQQKSQPSEFEISVRNKFIIGDKTELWLTPGFRTQMFAGSSDGFGGRDFKLWHFNLGLGFQYDKKWGLTLFYENHLSYSPEKLSSVFEIQVNYRITHEEKAKKKNPDSEEEDDN